MKKEILQRILYLLQNGISRTISRLEEMWNFILGLIFLLPILILEYSHFLLQVFIYSYLLSPFCFLFQCNCNPKLLRNFSEKKQNRKISKIVFFINFEYYRYLFLKTETLFSFSEEIKVWKLFTFGRGTPFFQLTTKALIQGIRKI